MFKISQVQNTSALDCSGILVTCCAQVLIQNIDVLKQEKKVLSLEVLIEICLDIYKNALISEAPEIESSQYNLLFSLNKTPRFT